MEYQTTGWLSPKLKQLEAENARLREELSTVRVLNRALTKNAMNRQKDCPTCNTWGENAQLREELACTKDILEQTRVELVAWKQTAEAHKENFDILAGDLRMKLAAAQADAARLDFVESQAATGMKWLARNSSTGRGYRIHQCKYGEHVTVRAAIDEAMKEVGHEQV